MEGREFKDAMYDGLAKLMKALANKARLEIIEMLSQGENSVEGVVAAKSNPVDLHARINHFNKEKSIYKGQIGLNDMNILVNVAK